MQASCRAAKGCHAPITDIAGSAPPPWPAERSAGLSLGEEPDDLLLNLNASDAQMAKKRGSPKLCVPRTSSALISRRNRLTSAHHNRAAMFRNCGPAQPATGRN